MGFLNFIELINWRSLADCMPLMFIDAALGLCPTALFSFFFCKKSLGEKNCFLKRYKLMAKDSDSKYEQFGTLD